METATRRRELRELIAQIPEARGQTGLLIAEVLGPYFESEDDVLGWTRALAAADDAAQKVHALMLHAARESQVGTAAHQAEWMQAFDRLESEDREAKADLRRARAELERAVAVYYTLQSELRDEPVLLESA